MGKGNVDMELIKRYILGELAPREMYALERQAQADPMLMDIILGMEQEVLNIHDRNLANIRKRIAERAGQRQAAIRRLAPAQRWAIAASILTLLTVGAWWFTRQGDVDQREATIAATPADVPAEAPQAGPSPEPATPTGEKETDATPGRLRTAPQATREERKNNRLAMTTPETENDTDTQEHAVVGYSAQKKSTATRLAARIAAAEMDTPVVASDQPPGSHTDGIHLRGVGARPAVYRLNATAGELTDKPNEPQPKDGWDAYRKHLEDAMKLAGGEKGTVDLAFTVDKEGRPAAVTVIETTNEKLNAFATLIVRDGPRWLPGENDGCKLILRIEF